uniref:Uncharacterized protein n=3 Tax=Aegilops tauschii subsp. strangulata TaxID=200361 RepID=A0A453ET80_AEGTS
ETFPRINSNPKTLSSRISFSIRRQHASPLLGPVLHFPTSTSPPKIHGYRGCTGPMEAAANPSRYGAPLLLTTWAMDLRQGPPSSSQAAQLPRHLKIWRSKRRMRRGQGP